MGTTITWNGEGGTAGTTITTGNSGGASGDAFAAVTGTCTFSATGKAHGSLGLLYNVTTTAWRAYHSFTATSQIAGRIYLTANALPSATVDVFDLINSSFAANVKLRITSAGKLAVVNAAGSAVFTSTASLVAGTTYRIEFQVDVGSTSSNGTIKMQWYTLDGGTAIETYTTLAGNAGAGVQIVRAQLGDNTSSTVNLTFDDLMYVTDSMTPVGAVSTLPAPADTVHVYAVTSNPNSWTIGGSAGDIPTAVSDTDDTTYVETPDNPANSTIVLRLAPMTGRPGYVTVQAQADSGTQTLKIELLQGATVRSATTAQVLTTAWANYTLNLTSGERAAITTAGDGSVSDLDVRLTGNTP